jgi:hypothetical protein
MSSMKNSGQFAFLFLILTFLSGCKTYQTPDCSLRGNCEVDQPNHIVQLKETKARGFYSDKSSGELHFLNDGDSCSANAFTLTFIGKDKQTSIDSIQGSCEYESKTRQPLELAYLDKSIAVFVFHTNSPTSLEYGKYKLNVEYVFNGQSNSCVFNVNYVHKTKTHVSFFWDLYWSGGL